MACVIFELLLLEFCTLTNVLLLWHITEIKRGLILTGKCMLQFPCDILLCLVSLIFSINVKEQSGVREQKRCSSAL